MIDYNKINYDTNIFQNDGIDDEIDDTDDEFILNINDKNKFDTNFNNNNNYYLNKLNNTLFNSFNLIDYFKNDTTSSSSSSSSSSLSSASSSPLSSSSSSYVNTMPNTKLYNDDIIVNHYINNDPTFSNNNYNIKTIGFDTDDNYVNNYGINTIFNTDGIGNNNEKQFNIFSAAAATTAAAVTTTTSSYDYNQLDLLNEYTNSNNTILLNLSNNLTNSSSIIYDDDTLISRCPDFSDQDFARFEFWICGVILNFVGLLGILGNILSMIILSRPQMRSSINYLLIGLARCDTVLIITSILLFGIPSIYPYTGYLFYYYYYIYPNISPCMFPIAMAAQTSSVYMTFTVTLERYVAVCHPLKARALCTYGRAKIYFIICIVFAFVYNIPRFWEVIVITDTLNYNNNNVPIYNNINNLHINNNSHIHHHFGSNGNAPNIDGINSNSNSGSSSTGARNPTLINTGSNTINFGDGNVGNSGSNSNSNSHTNRINSNSNSFYNNNNNNNHPSNSNNNLNFDDSGGGIGELFLNNNYSYDNIITNNNNNNIDNDNDNGNNVIFCVVASSLRRNDQYINIYIHWCYLIFIYFIPFLSLAILNCLIYRQVQKANRERQRLSRTERREIGLATMLLCVVIVFFLFNFLALYTNILEAFYDIIDDYLIKISNLLVTINSSANFIIYVIFGEKFKRIFFLLFCKGRMSRDQPDLIHYESSISNGEGNNRSSGRFSRHGTQRSTTAISLNRGNNIMNSNNNINNNNNNNNNSNNNNNGIPTSVRITTKRIKRNRAPSPGPCVYYPARDVQRTQTVITPSSSLHFDCYNNKNGGMMTSGF